MPVIKTAVRVKRGQFAGRTGKVIKDFPADERRVAVRLDPDKNEVVLSLDDVIFTIV